MSHPWIDESSKGSARITAPEPQNSKDTLRVNHQTSQHHTIAWKKPSAIIGIMAILVTIGLYFLQDWHQRVDRREEAIRKMVANLNAYSIWLEKSYSNAYSQSPQEKINEITMSANEYSLDDTTIRLFLQHASKFNLVVDSDSNWNSKDKFEKYYRDWLALTREAASTYRILLSKLK